MSNQNSKKDEKLLMNLKIDPALKEAKIQVLELGKDIDNLQRLPYDPSDIFEERIPLLNEAIKKDGQKIPLIINYREDEQTYYVVLGWERLEALVDMGIKTILAYLISVSQEEEQRIFEDYNLIYAKLPDEVEDEIMLRRLERISGIGTVEERQDLINVFVSEGVGSTEEAESLTNDQLLEQIQTHERNQLVTKQNRDLELVKMSIEVKNPFKRTSKMLLGQAIKLDPTKDAGQHMTLALRDYVKNLKLERHAIR